MKKIIKLKTVHDDFKMAAFENKDNNKEMFFWLNPANGNVLQEDIDEVHIYVENIDMPVIIGKYIEFRKETPIDKLYKEYSEKNNLLALGLMNDNNSEQYFRTVIKVAFGSNVDTLTGVVFIPEKCSPNGIEQNYVKNLIPTQKWVYDEIN